MSGDIENAAGGRPSTGDTGPARVVRLRSGVEWQHVDGEIVALDLNGSAYLAVNETGAVLWPLVADGATEARLVEELTARFDVDARQARADVGAFVQQLRALTLVDEG